MTKREAAIVTMYTGFLCGNFSDAHEYAEEIMCRPIFTHELANKDLCAEIKEKCKPDFVAIKVENSKELVETENQLTTNAGQK